LAYTILTLAFKTKLQKPPSEWISDAKQTGECFNQRNGQEFPGLTGRTLKD